MKKENFIPENQEALKYYPRLVKGHKSQLEIALFGHRCIRKNVCIKFKHISNYIFKILELIC